MRSIILSLFTVSVLGLTFTACQELEDPKPDEIQEITMHISHLFETDSLVFTDQEYTLESGEVVKFNRLSYLLSNFYLQKADGSKHQLADYYMLINAHSQETRFTLKEIPMGGYTAIGFSIGLDSAINHGNPNQYDSDHPLSPINNSLHWNWQGGYIFTALEGKIPADAESFAFHLAGSQNKLDFHLPINFTKEEAGLVAQLSYDVSEVFKNPFPYSLENNGTSAHSATDFVTLSLIGNMADVLRVDFVR